MIGDYIKKHALLKLGMLSIRKNINPYRTPYRNAGSSVLQPMVSDGLISNIPKAVIGVLRYKQIFNLWDIYLQMMITFAILRVI